VVRSLSQILSLGLALSGCVDSTLSISSGIRTAAGGGAGGGGGAAGSDAGVNCAALDCDDHTPCTTDSCDPARGCQHDAVADGVACDDGLFCNGQETCHGGVCGGAVAPCPGVCVEATHACGNCTARADCAADTATAWDACSGFAGTCGESGNHTRATTTWACVQNQCVATTRQESQACSRTTTGVSCAPDSWAGSCAACTFALGCGTLGVGSQSGQHSSCGGGNCQAQTVSRSCDCAPQACTGEGLLYALPNLSAQLDAGTATLMWTVGGPAVPLDTTIVTLAQTNQPLTQVPTWNVSALTGFPEAAPVVRGVSTAAGSSAVQLGTRAVGLYLNSCSSGTSARDVVQPLTLSLETSADVRPFSDASTWPELALRFQATIPTLTTKGAAASTASVLLRFRDKSKAPPGGQPAWYYDFWVNLQLADSRGAPQPEGVVTDGCGTCSGLPMLLTAPSGLAAPSRFMHTFPGAPGGFSGASPTPLTAYDLRISTDEFNRITAAVAAFSSRGLSTNPWDYQLVQYVVAPQVLDPTPSALGCTPASEPDWGTIGMTVQALSFAMVPWSNIPRIEYVGANAAGTGGWAQTFFQRVGGPGWNPDDSIWAPLPADGAEHTARFNTFGNPAWRGTLSFLRFDPFGGNGPFNVQSITVYGLNNVVQFFDDFTVDPASPANTWVSVNISAWGWEPDHSTWDGTGINGDPLFAHAVSFAAGR
jgi:hypothetical protein